MMPNYKDLKPTEVIGRIVAHEMSLKDKEELHNKSSGAYKASSDAPTTWSDKLVSNELSLMVKNFNNFYKSRSKDRSPSQGPTMRKDLWVMIVISTIVEDPDTPPMSVRLPTRKEKTHQKGEVEVESPHRERRSRDDCYERRPSRISKDSEGKDKSS